MQLSRNITQIFRFSSSHPSQAAIILSGCGVYDGTEITEAVSLMVWLQKYKIDITFFAPNKQQLHTINHANGTVIEQQRNVFEESARITRGSIKDLNQFKVSDFRALYLPGGFGVAKNLSDFALNGEKMTVIPELRDIIIESHKRIYIGACCISPLILANILGHHKVKLTLGKASGDEWKYKGTIDVAKSFGVIHEEKNINEICHDKQNKIVTTPAFMCDNAKFNQVFGGIGKMVKEIKHYI